MFLDIGTREGFTLINVKYNFLLLFDNLVWLLEHKCLY
jgi:hypothetical protein